MDGEETAARPGGAHRFTLHFFPGSCSIVPLIALEEAGADYELALVRLDLGAHVKPDFLALNPWAKVPVLGTDGGRPLAEIPAIARYLDALFPKARLMPRSDGDPLAEAEAWSVLSWFSSTLHPLVTRVRRPAIFAGPDHADTVRAIAAKQLMRQLALVERRADSASGWMLDDWSMVDAYLLFIAEKAEQGGLDLSSFPALAALRGRLFDRPAVKRALAAERAAGAEVG